MIHSRRPATKIGRYQRLLDLHHDYYLTLISIIQGIVFGCCLIESRSIWPHIHNLQVALNTGTMVIVMILAWKEYIIGTTAFAWIPRLPDTILPFFLGLCQVYTFYQIQDTPHFLAGLACVGLVSFAAYINMYANAARYEVNRYLLNKTRIFSWLNLSSTLLVSATYLLLYRFYQAAYGSWYSIAIFVIILLYMLRSYFYWETIIRAIGWIDGRRGGKFPDLSN